MAINEKVIKSYTKTINQLTASIKQTMNMSLTQAVNINVKSKRDEYIQSMFDKLIQPQIDKSLGGLRNEIVKVLHEQYVAATDQVAILRPICEVSIARPDDVVGWAHSVINYFTGPYAQALQATIELLEVAIPLTQAMTSLKSEVEGYKSGLSDEIKEAIDVSTLPVPSITLPTITPQDIITG